MLLLNVLFILLLQTVQNTGRIVTVGLGDGQQLVIENPEFSGFIDGRAGDAVLMYRQQNFHGELPLRTISRIEFGEYKKGGPYPMTVTLKNGQKLEVQSERRDFMTVKGKTDFGTVTVKHPDPSSAPIKITTKSPNRKKDLTILYLEIP